MNSRKLGALLMVSLLVAAPSAQAYLDPGTGSLIIQGAIAGLAAVAVTGRLYWQRIKDFFRKSPSPPAEQLEEQDNDDIPPKS